MDLTLNNDDLLTEILVRLPAKSLIRFKSVCKKWLSLISSDHFCHQHTLRRPKLQPSLILRSDTLQLFYLNPSINGEKMMIPYSLSVADHIILQECNGLMLLKSERFRNSYCVYNPTTRRSRKISLIKSGEYPYVRGMGLAFNPSKSPYYKIVCVKSTSNSENPFKQFTYKIEVYDSESRTWELGLKAFTYPRRIYFCSTGVHWNNAICWCTGQAYCYFDMAKNVIRAVSYPRNPNSETFSYVVHHLQESNGHLCHVAVLEDMDGFESVTMWELGGDEDQNPQWLLKYHHHPTAGCAGIVRLVAGSDAQGACSLLFSWDGKFKAYSFLDKTYEDLVDIPFELLDVFQFGEILAVV